MSFPSCKFNPQSFQTLNIVMIVTTSSSERVFIVSNRHKKGVQVLVSLKQFTNFKLKSVLIYIYIYIYLFIYLFWPLKPDSNGKSH